MAVVINEFEIVPEAPRPAGASPAQAGGAPPAAASIEPKDLTPVLRVLQVQALRAWAH